MTIDLTSLGQQRTLDLYDVPGDGVPTLEYYDRISVYAAPGDVMLRFTASADLGRGGTFEVPLRILPRWTPMAIRCADKWETAFGMSPPARRASMEPTAIPMVTAVNRDEYLRRSHPRGLYTRYFPEGADGDFFSTLVQCAAAARLCRPDAGAHVR